MTTASSVQENQKLFFLLFVQYPVVPTVVFGKPVSRKLYYTEDLFSEAKPYVDSLCVRKFRTCIVVLNEQQSFLGGSAVVGESQCSILAVGE
jgi:hypothetical protein